MDNALAGCPLLAELPEAALKRDCPSARVVSVPHRGAVYRQGEPAPFVFCVLEGQISTTRLSADGAALTTGLLGNGDFFGPALGGSLGGLEMAEDTAKAKGPASIWRARHNEFQGLLHRHPDAALKFIAALARRQRQME